MILMLQLKTTASRLAIRSFCIEVVMVATKGNKLSLKSQDVPTQVFNLHLMPSEKLSRGNGMLLLNASLGILECHNTLQNTMICHQSIPENTFYVINDLSLVIHFFIQVKKLFTLERLHDLRLLDRERL